MLEEAGPQLIREHVSADGIVGALSGCGGGGGESALRYDVLTVVKFAHSSPYCWRNARGAVSDNKRKSLRTA